MTIQNTIGNEGDTEAPDLDTSPRGLRESQLAAAPKEPLIIPQMVKESELPEDFYRKKLSDMGKAGIEIRQWMYTGRGIVRLRHGTGFILSGNLSYPTMMRIVRGLCHKHITVPSRIVRLSEFYQDIEKGEDLNAKYDSFMALFIPQFVSIDERKNYLPKYHRGVIRTYLLERMNARKLSVSVQAPTHINSMAASDWWGKELTDKLVSDNVSIFMESKKGRRGFEVPDEFSFTDPQKEDRQ